MKRAHPGDEPPPPPAADGGFAALCAAAALRAYSALPRSGKPSSSGEWTHLAAFLVTEGGEWGGGPDGWAAPPPPPLCVALATGTKCLGASQRSARGEVLHDCHAEVLARRAFQAWLYAQLHLAASPAAPPEPHADSAAAPRAPAERSIFEFHPPSSGEASVDGGGGGSGPLWRLRPGVRFHLYISHPPCGDASLVEGGLEEGSEGGGGGGGVRRTGAKVAGEEAPLPGLSWREAGGAPQAVGCARRKPGRGEPTLSMSCSDKIGRWAALGCQGALLARLLHAPLRLDCICLGILPQGEEGGGKTFVSERLRSASRALVDRFEPLRNHMRSLGGGGAECWQFQPPRVLPAPAPTWPTLLPPPPFSLSQQGRPRAAAGCSILWHPGMAVKGSGAELVESGSGRRAGSTAAAVAAGNPKTVSGVCRAAMLARYRGLLEAVGRAEEAGGTYGECKGGAPGGYLAARAALLVPPSPLVGWVAKPEGEMDFR